MQNKQEEKGEQYGGTPKYKYEIIYSDQTVIGYGGGFEGKTIDMVVLKRLSE